MARGISLAVCLVLAWAAPAFANSGAINNVKPLGDGLFSGTFTASVDTCSDPCRWSARVTIVAAGDACAARKEAPVVYAGAEHVGPGTHGPIDHVYYSDTEGAFKLCLVIAHGETVEVVAEHVHVPATPEPAPCRPGPSDPACGGIPPPPNSIDNSPRLMRRVARHAADRNLRRHRPGGYAGDPERKLTCRRIDATEFRCTASWRFRGVAHRSRLLVHVVAGRLRVDRRSP